MARTLTILATLPNKIRDFKRQIEVQYGIIEKAEQNYNTQLNDHRGKIEDISHKTYNKFRGRSYLAAAQLTALLAHMFCRDSWVTALLIVITSLGLFAACFEPLWFWVLWSRDITKPQYPTKQVNSCFNAIRKLKEEIRKHLQGFRGEQLVAYYLANNLPDRYNIINDVTLYLNGKGVQIDHVVVGPTGVFAVETKNITGNYFPDAQGWLRYPAHTIKGIPVRNYRRMVISCPQEQSLRQAISLENYLLVKGITVKVNNVIVIPNKECKWNGGPKDKQAPVVALLGLLRYIRKQKQNLNDPQIEKIITELLRLDAKKPLSVQKS